MTSSSFPAVFRALAGSYLRREKGRTLLTMLGIALGVTVLVAIELANQSAIESFRRNLADLAGRATVTVRGNGAPLRGDLVARLRELGGDRIPSIAPMITGDLYITAENGKSTETLQLVGVDILATEERGELPIRDLAFKVQPGLSYFDFLTNPELIVVTAKLADRREWRTGDVVPLLCLGRERMFRIGAIIEGGTLAELSGGNLVLVDIGMADVLLRRSGGLDRIDLVTAEGIPPSAMIAELSPHFGPEVIIELPETRSTQVEEMLAAFRFNLAALGYISLLVGAFLIFNTMSIAVVRRRPVIGTLRALGVSRGAVRAVFLAEGAILGCIGGLLGLLLGVALAAGLVGVVSDAISINFVRIHSATLVPDAWILLRSFLFGAAFSLAAALGPANEAASTPPANTMRTSGIEGRRTPLSVLLLLGAALSLGSLLLLHFPEDATSPWPGYVASNLCIGAAVCFSRPLLLLLSRLARIPFRLLFGAEGLLAVASTRGALGRSSIAISGLMIGLAMTLAVGVMVASFRDTVVLWMNQVLHADLFIAPRPAAAFARPDLLPATLADRIAEIPGVAAVDPFRGRRIRIAGRDAWLGSGRFDVVRFTNPTLDGRPAREVLAEAFANRGAIMSESLSRKTGMKVGDSVAIPTPRGEAEFRIAGIYYEYSSEQGYVIVDRDVYLELFEDPWLDTLSVFLADGADAQAVRTSINEVAARDPAAPPLDIRSSGDIRKTAIAAFDRTFAVTHALKIIAIVVAVLGVVATLLAQIMDRRREIATLRHLGATRGSVARIIMLEAGLIAVAGIILGTAAGLVLAWVLTRHIMLQSFGWSIDFSVPPGEIGSSVAIVLVATLLAGFLPAREAGRVNPLHSEASR